MSPKRSYDDLETDYLEEENESGFLSLVSVVIAFIAVAVFIALAWYAYQSNTGTGSSGEIEVVYPEEGPVREAPEESGGWQFPHQDKSVYNIVSGENAGEKGGARVEQILPAPEQAIERPEVETKVWMNDKLKREPIAQTDAERRMVTQEKQQESAEEPKPEEKAETPVEKQEAAAREKTTAVAEKAVAEEKQEETAEVKEEVSKPVPVASPQKHKPVAASNTSSSTAVSGVSGNSAVQLGAVRSDADARAQWQRLQKKHSLLAGKTLRVQQADVPGKGTFYRIQAVGFASRADAEAACGKLAAAGQACFAVGK